MTALYTDFTADQLRRMLIAAAESISSGGIAQLDAVATGFIACGFEAKAFLGEGHAMDQTPEGQLKLLHWLIGQIIDIGQTKAYFAVNSWCNWVLGRLDDKR
jgi:hypothetical protein